MMSNYRERTRQPAAPVSISSPDEKAGLGVRVLERLHQLYCTWRGHDDLLHFEHERMFLKCVSCGYESPVWVITEARVAGDGYQAEARPRLVRPHLIGIRRVA